MARCTAVSMSAGLSATSIPKMDRAGRSVEESQATRASTSGKLSDSDTFAQSSYVRWSTNSYDDAGMLEHSRVYHTIPSSGAGSSGTNYDQTNYGYDLMDRQNMVKSPGGTITRTVFTVGPTLRGRQPTAVYIGTDDTSATESDPTGGAQNNNMVLVSECEYDGGNDGGDGLLSKQRSLLPEFSAAHDYLSGGEFFDYNLRKTFGKVFDCDLDTPIGHRQDAV